MRLQGLSGVLLLEQLYLDCLAHAEGADCGGASRVGERFGILVRDGTPPTEGFSEAAAKVLRGAFEVGPHGLDGVVGHEGGQSAVQLAAHGEGRDFAAGRGDHARLLQLHARVNLKAAHGRGVQRALAVRLLLVFVQHAARDIAEGPLFDQAVFMRVAGYLFAPEAQL